MNHYCICWWVRGPADTEAAVRIAKAEVKKRIKDQGNLAVLSAVSLPAQGNRHAVFIEISSQADFQQISRLLGEHLWIEDLTHAETLPKEEPSLQRYW